MSEVPLDKASIQRFRSGYIAAFGAVLGDDPLYEAVSAGRKQAGMEHWLPLFHERLETVFDYTGDAPVTLDHQVEESHAARLTLIADYHEARVLARQETRAAMKGLAPPYKPLAPETLYVTDVEWGAALEKRGGEAVLAVQAGRVSGRSTRAPCAGATLRRSGRLRRTCSMRSRRQSASCKLRKSAWSLRAGRRGRRIAWRRAGRSWRGRN